MNYQACAPVWTVPVHSLLGVKLTARISRQGTEAKRNMHCHFKFGRAGFTRIRWVGVGHFRAANNNIRRTKAISVPVGPPDSVILLFWFSESNSLLIALIKFRMLLVLTWLYSISYFLSLFVSLQVKVCQTCMVWICTKSKLIPGQWKHTGLLVGALWSRKQYGFIFAESYVQLWLKVHTG